MRRVVCAANRYMDYMLIGARHWDFLMHKHYEGIAPSNEILDTVKLGDWEQGFVDQHGIFMTREEDWIVADAAGQIIRRVGGDGNKLFSENLY